MEWVGFGECFDRGLVGVSWRRGVRSSTWIVANLVQFRNVTGECGEPIDCSSAVCILRTVGEFVRSMQD